MRLVRESLVCVLLCSTFPEQVHWPKIIDLFVCVVRAMVEVYAHTALGPLLTQLADHCCVGLGNWTSVISSHLTTLCV